MTPDEREQLDRAIEGEGERVPALLFWVALLAYFLGFHGCLP